MYGSQGLLEKLARLGINLIPQGAAMTGGALGGPAGAVAGGALGSGLEQLLQPQQSQFGGAGMQVGQGMPMNTATGEQDRLQKALGALSMQGAMGAGELLPDSNLDTKNEWFGIFQKLMQSVPREEIMKFLEQRNRPQIEGM